MNTKIIRFALVAAAIMFFIASTIHAFLDDERWFSRYAMFMICFAAYGIIKTIEEKK